MYILVCVGGGYIFHYKKKIYCLLPFLKYYYSFSFLFFIYSHCLKLPSSSQKTYLIGNLFSLIFWDEL